MSFSAREFYDRGLQADETGIGHQANNCPIFPYLRHIRSTSPGRHIPIKEITEVRSFTWKQQHS